jgi:hypothetical protein
MRDASHDEADRGDAACPFVVAAALMRDATTAGRDALTQWRRTKKSHGQQEQNREHQGQCQERGRDHHNPTVRDHENTLPLMRVRAACRCRCRRQQPALTEQGG